jgi:hypothetical protein
MSESEKEPGIPGTPLPRITDPKAHLVGYIILLEAQIGRLRAHVGELNDVIGQRRLSIDLDELNEFIEQLKKNLEQKPWT